jgi:hypothetical protein
MHTPTVSTATEASVTLARKGSRPIHVDGVEYRWKVRNPTYSRAVGWSTLTFVVEHATEPGTLLVVNTAQARPDNWLAQPSPVIRPEQVASAIRSAQAQRWQPTQRGAAMQLDVP